MADAKQEMIMDTEMRKKREFKHKTTEKSPNYEVKQ